MDNDIKREINIEQVEFGIDIDNIEYSIEINPRDTFAIELNEQGPQGARGYTGNGIVSIDKTSTAGLVDTYTITFTDGNTTTFNITNGEDGINPTVTVGSTTTGNPGTNASVVNTGTAQDVILDFTIPRGDKGETGEDGAAATITVGTVTTGLPTDPASVTNVGTSSAAVLDFTIPKGDTGDTGATGNGIASITKTGTVGLVDTYTILYTDGTTTTFTVTNGRDGSGSVTDVTVNGTSVLDGSVAKVLVPTDNTQLTNGAGYITGITSGDVTTALGYTPLSNATKYGADLSYSSNTLQLLDQDGNALGSSVTIQSSPDIDNKSITTNISDELQTVGVINQNNTSNAIKTWTGTKVQYDAIVTKDANTLYNITDDTDVTLSLLELLYPVGSIYIGTMATCPLQTLGIGTWQLVATDRVLQGAGTRGSVGDTVNESLPNITGSLWLGVGQTQAGNGVFRAFQSSQNRNSVSNGNGWEGVTFDASRSSSIYQDSAPVQQDAYLVNIWERIS